MRTREELIEDLKSAEAITYGIDVDKLARKGINFAILEVLLDIRDQNHSIVECLNMFNFSSDGDLKIN